MHGLLQEPPKDHLSLCILSFQNFYGGICLYLAQLSVKLAICRLSFVCYHCLDYVRSVVLKLGSAVLLGSARQFSGTVKNLTKKSTRRSCRNKFCGK